MEVFLPNFHCPSLRHRVSSEECPDPFRYLKQKRNHFENCLIIEFGQVLIRMARCREILGSNPTLFSLIDQGYLDKIFSERRQRFSQVLKVSAYSI